LEIIHEGKKTLGVFCLKKIKNKLDITATGCEEVDRFELTGEGVWGGGVAGAVICEHGNEISDYIKTGTLVFIKNACHKITQPLTTCFNKDDSFLGYCALLSRRS
jgi:hypothetical protein